ncbi:MAG: hypothetical protein ACTSW4_00180 [Candidatus Ranarchaeia archaeon]
MGSGTFKYKTMAPLNQPDDTINTIIRDAYQYYVELGVEDNVVFYALNVIRRFLTCHEGIKEPRPFYAAVLYIAKRHPFTYPNHTIKADFANKSRIKISSLEWYTDMINSTLGFYKIYDRRHFPYFLDPYGIIHQVISAVIRDRLDEAKIKQMLGLSSLNIRQVARDVTNWIVNRLKLLPAVFKTQIQAYIVSLIRAKVEPNEN